MTTTPLQRAREILEEVSAQPYKSKEAIEVALSQLQELFSEERLKAQLEVLQTLLPEMSTEEYGYWVRERIAEQISELESALGKPEEEHDCADGTCTHWE